MRTGDGYPGETLVLCYHAVSETWPAELSVTTAQLREQLEVLVGRGYRGATFQEAVTTPRSGRTLVVTFDDGFRSVLELAFPILSSLGLQGTVFAVSEAAAGRLHAWPGPDHWLGSPHAHELETLTWGELARLADAGWEIGSHTRRHARLTQLGDAELADELRGSREACEAALGRPCLSLAYPYGDFDERVTGAAADAGYGFAATLPPPLTRPAPLAWPRVGVYRNTSPLGFRMKTSPAVRRLRTRLAPLEARLRA